MSAMQDKTGEPDATELKIALILRYRHSDNMVNTPEYKPNSLISEAIDRGFIDVEGFLTRKGRALIARYGYL
jgi:hypothetical protein